MEIRIQRNSMMAYRAFLTVYMFMILFLPKFLFAANVSIDGSIEYQSIQGIGGQLDGPCDACSSQFWDNLFNEVGVSSIYVITLPNHSESDQEGIFPVLTEAKAHGVKTFYVQFMDYPEGWSDTNDYLLPQYYDEMANHMLAYTNYIKTNTGVDISDICAIDEPSIGDQPPFIRFKITASEYVNFLKIAGPIIRGGNSSLKIHVPVSWNIGIAANYANIILSDPVARNYVDVVGTHAYGWPNQSNPQKWQDLASIAQQYNKNTSNDETWHGGSNNPGPHPAGLNLSKWIHHSFVDGHATNFMWWDMYDKGQYRTQRGFVYSKEWPPGEFTSDGITKHGYAFKQFAHWIRPGAIRMETVSSDLNVLVSAYKHPTIEAFTIVAINDSTNTKSVTIDIKNANSVSSLNAYRTSATENSVDLGKIPVISDTFTYSLPKESITTFTGLYSFQDNTPPDPPTGLRIKDSSH